MTRDERDGATAQGENATEFQVGARRQAREHALRVLYQAEARQLGAAEALSGHWQVVDEPDKDVRRFAERLAVAGLSLRDDVDAILRECSHNWSLERMTAIDRNLLRLAVSELMAEPGTPPAVVIDEAIEIAREYGDADSTTFVHGVLEAARRQLAARGRLAFRAPAEDA